MLEGITINLHELNTVTIMFRMFLAIVVGGIIGTERDIKQRAAGMRTHMLVCMGAAIVVMTNEYMYINYGGQGIDITRMGAQVISGIGFLGAGTILVTNDNRIQGLTTAAGLWAAATLGLAIGIGFYEIAIIGGITMIAVVTLMKPFRDYVLDRSPHFDLTLMVHSRDGFKSFLRYTVEAEIQITNLQIEMDSDPEHEDGDVIFIAELKLSEDVNKQIVLQQLKAIHTISQVIEMDSD